MTPANAALTQARKDVPVDSSPTKDDTQTPATEDTTPPAPAAGKKAGDGDSDSKNGGRGIDEVRGEFDRKQVKTEKSMAELRSEISELKGLLTGLTAGQPAVTVTPDINLMSADELAAQASKVPEAQKAEFDNLVAQKRRDEAVDARFNSNLAKHEYKKTREESNQLAYARWPELNDPQGAFYAETNKVLDEMGSRAKNNPYSVREAANEAGLRLGLTPKARSIMIHQHGIVGGGTAPAPHSDPNSGKGLSKEKVKEISTKLSGALRSGKFSPEALERVEKSSKQYDANRSLYRK